MQCFRIFPERRSLGRERGSIKIIRRIIFLSQCRKTSWGKLVEQCFRNFPVAKKFVDKRGGVTRFSVKKKFSHSAEYFVGQPYCAVFNKISGSEKVYGQKAGGGGSIKIFRRKTFLSQCQKIRRRMIYCFTNFRFRKMLGIKEMGKHQDFPSKIFCLIVPNIL